MHSMDRKEEFSVEKFISRLQLKRHSLSDLILEISPQIYTNLRLAIELSKWPDGRLLNTDQKESCMQLMILYEADHVPEIDRVGFNLPVVCSKEVGTKGPEVLRILDRESERTGNPLLVKSESNPGEDVL